MKNISILSLAQAYDSLQKGSYTKFLSYYGIDIRNEEVEDLKSLVVGLYNETTNIRIFDQFYVSFKIPQIGKEFDLLKIGENCTINIEIKRTSDEEKIKKQLIRNRYYLSTIGDNIKLFSFISKTNQLYFLNDNNNVVKVKFSYLVHYLEEQAKYEIINIHNLFSPSSYLVSPFNSTDKFIKDEYFLTSHQEEVRDNVIKIIKDNTSTKFISITGSAGTGKTLLIYDIAKEIIKTKNRVLIIHCGNLNDGQQKLNDEYDWEIIPIKDYAKHDLSDYGAIIIDETQRIRSSQLNKIVESITSNNGKCIFSYDKAQTLSNWEEQNNIDQRISTINQIYSCKLTEKIRTNKEIANFIKLLFNNKKSITTPSNGNIHINYFDNIDDARDFIMSLNTSEWEILKFTPSQYKNEHHEKYSHTSNKASHGVIGQEFDSVVVTVDSFFYYNQNGDLKYSGNTYYNPVKMLFQNITRTRIRLNIVIINNTEILDRCVSILQS